MVKANELRIGNWVNWTKPTPSPTYEQVYIIDEDTVNECSIENIDPIPLTSEILEKCGFTETEDAKYRGVVKEFTLNVPMKGGNKHLINWFLPGKTNIVDKELYNFGNYTVNDFWASNNFKYLHQLQNLYFALTGEELEYANH